MARAYQVRSFDSLLKSRMKNAQMRQKIYKNLLTRLVQDERVVTTLTKCKDLSRVAERVCIYVNRIVSKIIILKCVVMARDNLLLTSKLKPGTVEKNSLPIGPPAGLERTLVL